MPECTYLYICFYFGNILWLRIRVSQKKTTTIAIEIKGTRDKLNEKGYSEGVACVNGKDENIACFLCLENTWTQYKSNHRRCFILVHDRTQEVVISSVRVIHFETYRIK